MNRKSFLKKGIIGATIGLFIPGVLANSINNKNVFSYIFDDYDLYTYAGITYLDFLNQEKMVVFDISNENNDLLWIGDHPKIPLNAPNFKKWQKVKNLNYKINKSNMNNGINQYPSPYKIVVNFEIDGINSKAIEYLKYFSNEQKNKTKE